MIYTYYDPKGDQGMKEINHSAKKMLLTVLVALLCSVCLFGILTMGQGGMASAADTVAADDPASELTEDQTLAIQAFKDYYAIFKGEEFDPETAGIYNQYVSQLEGTTDRVALNKLLKEAVKKFFGQWDGASSAVQKVAQEQQKAIEKKFDEVMESGELAVNLHADLVKAYGEIELRSYKNEKLMELRLAASQAADNARLNADSKSDIDALQAKAEQEIEETSVGEGDSALDDAKDDIDKIVDGAINAIAREEVEGIAKQEYLDTYTALTDTELGETLPEAVQAVLTDIEEATAAEAPIAQSAVSANKVVLDAVLPLIDGLLVRENTVLMDSAETKAIVVAGKQTVSDAVTGAAEGEVPDFSDIANGILASVNANRAAERDAAVAEIDAAAAEIKGDKEYPSEVGSEFDALVARAKETVGNARYSDLYLTVEHFKAQAELLDTLADLTSRAAQNEVDLTEIKEALMAALASVGKENDPVVFGRIKSEAVLSAEREYATALLRKLTEGGSSYVTGLLAGGNGFYARVGGASSVEAVQTIVEEAKIAIAGEKFLDRFGALRSSFEKLGADGKAELEEAKTAVSSLDPAVKAYLERESEYSSLEKEIEDRINKADFEAKRDSARSEIEKSVGENDGEYVREVQTEQLGIIGNTTYAPHSGDDTRSGYLDERKEALDAVLADAKTEIAHAKSVQSLIDEMNAELGEYLEDDNYSASQKAEMREKVEKYIADAKNVPSGGAGGKTAEEALAELRTKWSGELTASSVKSVTAGPDGDGSEEYGKDFDGKTLWGSVYGDSGIDRDVSLSIKKTEGSSESDVEKAIRNGKFKASVGSNLTEEKMKALTADKSVLATLEISLVKDNAALNTFTGKYTVKILLPEEFRGRALVLVYAAENGEAEVFDAEISEDGRYLTFTTDHFSEFVLLGEETVNMWWLVITLTAVFFAELLVLIVVLMKQGSKKGQKAASVLPLWLLAPVLPVGQTAACVLLGIAVIGLGIGIFFALKRKNS